MANRLGGNSVDELQLIRHVMDAYFPTPYWRTYVESDIASRQFRLRARHVQGNMVVDSTLESDLAGNERIIKMSVEGMAHQIHRKLMAEWTPTAARPLSGNPLHVNPPLLMAPSEPDQGCFVPLDYNQEFIQALVTVAGLEIRWRTAQGIAPNGTLWGLVRPGKWAHIIGEEFLHAPLERWQQIVSGVYRSMEKQNA